MPLKSFIFEPSLLSFLFWALSLELSLLRFLFFEISLLNYLFKLSQVLSQVLSWALSWSSILSSLLSALSSTLFISRSPLLTPSESPFSRPSLKALFLFYNSELVIFERKNWKVLVWSLRSLLGRDTTTAGELHQYGAFYSP